MYLSLLITWLLFIPIAILNGSIRNFLYAPYTGELLAHQISTLILITLFILISYLRHAKLFTTSTFSKLLSIGSFWVFLTILFEFGFGHFIMDNPWSRLIADYNILTGRIWGLFLISEFLSPLIIRALRSKPQAS